MNPDTGELLDQDNFNKLMADPFREESGMKPVKMNKALAEKMAGMNRKNKREYYKKHKEQFLMVE